MPNDSRGLCPGTLRNSNTPNAGNVPGGRDLANWWLDSSGNLWLFGGYGYDAAGYRGRLNDLWVFSPSTNQWAWMGGSSTAPGTGSGSGNPGVYGMLGIPAAGNIPGGRQSAVSWTDGSGNLWLFGGYGDDANGNQNSLNDTWRYQPSAPRLRVLRSRPVRAV